LVCELKKRASTEYLFNDPLHRSLARLLSKAVSAEKNLGKDFIFIHPDDPFCLLVWGWEDDVSALQFSLWVRKELNIDIPSPQFEDWFASAATVGNIIVDITKRLRR